MKLRKYLKNGPILNVNEFGLSKGKSTENALTMVKERVFASLNSKTKTVELFVNLKHGKIGAYADDIS